MRSERRLIMYHYTESGLDNIYLEDGFNEHETPYGVAISIEDTAGLHKAIGRWLIEQPSPIRGAELRFLRIEMETTQRTLAAILGTTEQTLRLWEKYRTRALPGSADRLLRALYSDYGQGDGSVRRMLERLAELDQGERQQEERFHKTNKGWKVPKYTPMERAAP